LLKIITPLRCVFGGTNSRWPKGKKMPRHDFSVTTNNPNYPNRTTAQSEWPQSANESFES
jgi:hypothetical protein